MLHTRLSRLEQRFLPPLAVRLADARMQARICANLHSVITGGPEPPYTAHAAADVALLADYAHRQGTPYEDPTRPADPTGMVAAALDWLANEATIPERIATGHALAAWANAEIDAGRDPDAELEHRLAARWATAGGGGSS